MRPTNRSVLSRQDIGGGIRIANPIYQEVIPRELGWNIQSGMAEQAVWYIESDGKLNLSKLLAAFQSFFREHSEHSSTRRLRAYCITKNPLGQSLYMDYS